MCEDLYVFSTQAMCLYLIRRGPWQCISTETKPPGNKPHGAFSQGESQVMSRYRDKVVYMLENTYVGVVTGEAECGYVCICPKFLGLQHRKHGF